MAFIVVDASVALKWFVRENGTELAQDLLGDERYLFLAPDIFRVEVVNGLLKQHRANQLTDELLDRALVELEAAMPHIVPSTSLLPRAILIARRLRHPIYDCLYLALAERWDTVFVTADHRFLKLCRAKLVDDAIVERLRSLDEFASP